MTHHAKYLGLPVVLGRSKKEVFSLVKDKIWKKLKGWKVKSLSRAGKEILIIYVAEAISNDVMSCFKFLRVSTRRWNLSWLSFVGAQLMFIGKFIGLAERNCGP